MYKIRGTTLKALLNKNTTFKGNQIHKMKTTIGFLCLFFMVNIPHGYAVEKFKLSSGYEIPAIGLGTFLIKPSDVQEAMTNALNIGYRHFDTAFVYKNEAAIGMALKRWFQSGGKREDLFITSKLPHYGNSPETVGKYLKRSLKDLDLEYVDMYLVHSPWGTKEGDNLTAARNNDGNMIFENVDHVALWKKMEEQVTGGRVRSIGLSNFNETQILNIYENAKIKPSNLQIESHVHLQQRSLRQFCRKHNIVMTAYAPLGSPKMRIKIHKGTGSPLTDLSEIKELANKYNKTTAQILLRHSVQAGLVVIPQSLNKDHQMENFDIFNFSLSEEDVEKINAMDKGEAGRVFDFIEIMKGVEKSPQYPFPRPA